MTEKISHSSENNLQAEKYWEEAGKLSQELQQAKFQLVEDVNESIENPEKHEIRTKLDEVSHELFEISKSETLSAEEITQNPDLAKKVEMILIRGEFMTEGSDLKATLKQIENDFPDRNLLEFIAIVGVIENAEVTSTFIDGHPIIRAYQEKHEKTQPAEKIAIDHGYYYVTRGDRFELVRGKIGKINYSQLESLKNINIDPNQFDITYVEIQDPRSTNLGYYSRDHDTLTDRHVERLFQGRSLIRLNDKNSIPKVIINESAIENKSAFSPNLKC